MTVDFQRLAADEQKIAKLNADRLMWSDADVAAAIIQTEHCTKLVNIRGLALQVCEAQHEEMQTAQDEAERTLNENLLNCAAEAALGGHDLGEW